MNKFVVVSDIHFPFQDDDAIKAFFRFLKENTVDTIILNGDIIDCYDVSRFDKDISRMNSLQKEINLVNKFFSRMREINPEAKIIFIKGNHEDRIERYLKKHNELFSLDVLKIPNLLNLEKYNIEYCDKFFKLGSLKITHGSIVRKFSGYTAHAEMDKNDCSGISGHCFSEDVEVLTPDGWKRIVDVNIGDTVGTINKIDQSFEFNKVQAKFVYDDYKELYHIKSSIVDVMVTDKHGLLGFNKHNGKLEEFDAKYLATTSKTYKFMCGALEHRSSGLPIKEELLRLIVNISADGSIEDNAIRFHLKKERKITHLKALLSSLGYEYSESKSKIGTTKIRIKTKDAKPLIEEYFSKGKCLPECLKNVNKEQAFIILDEYSITDGNKNKSAINSYQICSNKENEIDLLQEIFSKNGIRSSKLKRLNHFILTANTNPLTYVSRDNVNIVPYKGKVSCVSVDNGTLIIRSKGKTLVTQNTHRLGAFYKKTPSRYLAWFEGGCLCDINPEYVDNPDWQQGFIHGAIDKDSFTVEIVPILEGKIKKIV